MTEYKVRQIESQRVHVTVQFDGFLWVDDPPEDPECYKEHLTETAIDEFVRRGPLPEGRILLEDYQIDTVKTKKILV